MTYQITVAPNAISIDMTAPEYAISLQQVGQQGNTGATGPKGEAGLDGGATIPPGTGYKSATAVFDGADLRVVDAITVDDRVIRDGFAVDYLRPMPPGTGYTRATATEAFEVVEGQSVGFAGEGFAVSAVNGNEQVFWQGADYRRQVTYGPEDKRLLQSDAYGEVVMIRDTVAGQPSQGLAGRLQKQAASENVLRVVIVYGQSLALGNNGATTQYSAWFTTAPAPGQVLMLSSGVSPIQNNHNQTLVAGNLGTIVDAVNASSTPPQNNNDTAALTAALAVHDAHDRSGLVACVALGRGGTKIVNDGDDPAELQKGDYPYANVMTWLDRFIAQAGVDYAAYSVEVVAVAFVHGEADAADTAAQYKTKREALFADLIADIKLKTGQSTDPLMMVGQTATLASSAIIGPAQSALNTVIDGDGVLFFGPQYPYPGYVDASHGQPRLYTDHLGVAVGFAYREWVRRGTISALYATSAVMSGSVIDVTFNVPTGRLVSHPSITDPGYLGMTYEDDTDTAFVVGAEIISANVVRLTLNATPSGVNPIVTIAARGSGNPGPTSGARSPLCDQTRRINPITGQIMPHHAAMQEIAVTT